MKKEEIIRVIIAMQENAKLESKEVKAKRIDVPIGLDINGYKHYCEGWNDALKEILERIY